MNEEFYIINQKHYTMSLNLLTKAVISIEPKIISLFLKSDAKYRIDLFLNNSSIKFHLKFDIDYSINYNHCPMFNIVFHKVVNKFRYCQLT